LDDPAVLDAQPAAEESVLRTLEREDQARLVHRGLRALPSDLREPLVLCDLQGLSYDEVAEALRIPLGTVKSRINRDRLELARRGPGWDGWARSPSPSKRWRPPSPSR